MGSFPNMLSINDSIWTREGSYLISTQMDGCLGHFDNKIDS